MTRAAGDEDIADFPVGVEVYRLPAPTTTQFVNTYQGSMRSQRVLAQAPSIGPEDLDPRWREAKLVLLGPVLGEVEPAVARACEGYVGIGAQGWLRTVDDAGRVVPAKWSGGEAIDAARAIFVSVEDAPPRRLAGLVASWRRRLDVVATTNGPRGGELTVEGDRFPIKVFPAREVDPTGAGDVFAASFLARYAETSDPYEATEFAAAAAACSIEGEGTTAIPDREMISARRREVASG
ncbi:MAG: PfkB family carbohydrate kinase [Dehalococcoidia bacterium]